ncbi:hypothetical protein Tco_1288791, partial [Tanacetum coccineum]
MAPLPHHDLIHPWLRYQVDGYDKGTIHSYELWGIGEYDIHWDDGEALFTSHAWRRLFEVRLGGVRRRMTWRQFILALGLYSEEEMAKPRFGAYWADSKRVIPDKGNLKDYWVEILFDRDFLRPGAEKVTRVDLFYLRTMDRGTANVLHLLAQYLFHHDEGRKSGARLSRGYFIRRLAAHFGLISDEGLRGLSVVV